MLKGKEDDHTVIRQNVTDFMKTFTEISEVIDQEEISAMAIDKTLKSYSIKRKLEIVCNVGSICMCVQDGFFMYHREYPTEEELSVISYEVASVH